MSREIVRSSTDRLLNLALTRMLSPRLAPQVWERPCPQTALPGGEWEASPLGRAALRSTCLRSLGNVEELLTEKIYFVVDGRRHFEGEGDVKPSIDDTAGLLTPLVFRLLEPKPATGLCLNTVYDFV